MLAFVMIINVKFDIRNNLVIMNKLLSIKSTDDILLEFRQTLTVLHKRKLK